jgi:hypothetical protein
MWPTEVQNFVRHLAQPVPQCSNAGFVPLDPAKQAFAFFE